MPVSTQRFPVPLYWFPIDGTHLKEKILAIE
jgi:hypothetical protein